MPNFVTCFKWVVDEAYIRRGTSGTLDFSSVDYKISDYDRNALEEAVRLRENQGGSVAAVTVGIPEATKGLKDALSRGADQAYFIADAAFRDLEPGQTAKILGEVIRSRIPYDLILCGEGSSDLYTQQVGPRLAECLGIPSISFVQKIHLDGSRMTAERKVEEGVEIVTVDLPALVTVLPEINVPRIPGVKDTLMASKKPVATIRKDDLTEIGAPHLHTIGTTAAGMGRDSVRFGADAGDIGRFVDALRKKGVIA